MKQFLVTIPDNQVASFTKYVQEHQFDVIMPDTDFEVPEFHKEIVRERMKTTSDKDFTDWSTVKKSLRFKR